MSHVHDHHVKQHLSMKIKLTNYLLFFTVKECEIKVNILLINLSI